MKAKIVFNESIKEDVKQHLASISEEFFSELGEASSYLNDEWNPTIEIWGNILVIEIWDVSIHFPNWQESLHQFMEDRDDDYFRDDEERLGKISKSLRDLADLIDRRTKRRT